MRKKEKFLVFAIFVFVFYFSSMIFVNAGTFGYGFGGKIINTKAMAIKILEAEGFNCDSSTGTSIMVRTPSGNKDFIISSGIKSKTNNEVKPMQGILGKYFGTIGVACTKKNKDGQEIVKTVSLDSIVLFGNSKR